MKENIGKDSMPVFGGKPTRRERVAPTVVARPKLEPKRELRPEPKPAPKPLTPTPATPRKRTLSKNQLNYIGLIVLSLLTLIFMICTIFLLATRERSRNTQSDVTPINLSDLESTTLGFYTDKVKNNDKNYSYGENITTTTGEPVLSATILDDNSGIRVTINWRTAVDYYQINNSRNDTETFDVTYHSPIADLTIFSPTGEPKDSLILSLLADGTLEYMSVNRSLQNRSFVSAGRLGNYSDIVKFYQANITSNSESVPTLLLQDTSGNLYDLREQLLSAI